MLTQRSVNHPPMSTSAPRLRVLCVDDSPEIARMLARLLRDQDDMESLGVLSSTDGVVDAVARKMAQVLVLDLSMPGMPPLQAIKAVTKEVPSCRVLAYTGYDDPGTRCQARAAGACDLVSKRGDPQDIIHAIRRASGRTPIARQA